jgi:hypothetical protein
MLLALAASAALGFTFYADAPYDSSIPTPETTLGYSIGERTTNFRDQERTLMAIAESAGARVKVIEFGKSWEGRPLRLYAVSSPENMARLEQIRQDNLERNEGKSAKMDDPALVWVNECIHGDETASFESAMELIYNLAASRSPKVTEMLSKAVVLVNPCYNPDGHERYTVYYDSIATGSPEAGAFETSQPSTIYGRLNHYRFDMNRDRVAMSQQETREEVAEFLKWHPQVYVDQHGQVETYFFPPNAMSQNANVDRDRVNKWTDIFGRATGKSFDAQGWSYFVKDTFDLYYPGYLDSFTTLSGAIGMTHETDGGRVLAHRRGDDTVVTLLDGVKKHFTSALAVIGSASEHRSDLLTSFVGFKQKAVSGDFAGKFKRVVVEGDRRALNRLKAHLALSGIVSDISSQPLAAKNAHDYWSGKAGDHTFAANSLYIDMAQSQGPLAKALLDPGNDFEPEFVKAQLGKKKTAPEGETAPGPEEAEFYDTTAWSLPFAYNLHAWWCESAPGLKPGVGGSDIRSSEERSTVGYAIEYSDEVDALACADALLAGVHASMSSHAMTVGSRTFAKGTFLFLAARNEEGYDVKLREVAAKRGAVLLPLPSSYPESGRYGPGSESVIHMRKPKIAVVFGNGASMGQASGAWFAMDQMFHLPFTALSTTALNGNLSRYTGIVVPAGTGITLNQNLRDWISAGGCLVALGGINWATGASGLVDLQAVAGDHQSLPGALVRAQIDPRSFLSYGYDAAEISVPIEGSSFYKFRKEGGSVVKFSDDEKASRVLSGWAWPDETEKMLTGAVWLQDQSVGRGHAVLFTYDPTTRAMWPGLNRLLLNAMLIGPSAGN